ncbi:MAG: fumarylacetoacetate hydrolase family protein [Bacillota bacterium]|nr:fumarylacetoacetate hydrolase family protein [Bacillota bacterium]
MKIVRYLVGGKIYYGMPQDDGTALRIEGDIFGDYTLTDKADDLSACRLMSPCKPGKIVAIGKNYVDHIMEFDGDIPKNPIIFIKPSTAVIANGEAIVYPEISKRVDYEGELALVIKRAAHHVKREQARDYILGYTILNDVTARDIQASDGQWTRAKCFDTFAPVGPVITDEIDPDNVSIRTLLNGEIKQDSNTSSLNWKVDELVEFVTEVMTLQPGDIITTGTPSGIGPMEKGDTVEVVIEGIGTLKNYVK